MMGTRRGVFLTRRGTMATRDRSHWHSRCSSFLHCARTYRIFRMLNAVIGIRLKQQMALTPRLQQSVKLLQLSAVDCVQELHQAMALNPFLEEITDTPEDSEAVEGEADVQRDAQIEALADGEFEYPDAATSAARGSADDFPDWTE